MKRSLITLFLLAVTGLAQAASPAPVYSWEWTAEGAQVTAPGWTSFQYAAGNDYATFGTVGRPYNTAITGISGSFTVSFDVKNLTDTTNAWKDILSLYTNNTIAGNDNSLVLEFNGTGNICLYAKGFGGIAGGNIVTDLNWSDLSGANADVWHNLSLVSDMDNQQLSLYVDGSLAGSIDGWNPSSQLTGAQFGSSFGDPTNLETRPMNGTLDVNNIKFYNDAVRPIPEPATTSFGLLGAFALLARRRRKC